MQAIIAKLIPATNSLPARIKASCERGFLTLSYDDSEGDAFDATVKALCIKFDKEDAVKYGPEGSEGSSWRSQKVKSQIPSGEWVYIFTCEQNKVK